MEPKIMYKTSEYSYQIEAVTVVKETAKQVTTRYKDWRGYERERREAKKSISDQFHETWDAAKAYLVDRERCALEAAKREVDRRRSALQEAESLKQEG